MEAADAASVARLVRSVCLFVTGAWRVFVYSWSVACVCLWRVGSVCLFVAGAWRVFVCGGWLERTVAARAMTRMACGRWCHGGQAAAGLRALRTPAVRIYPSVP